MYQQTFPLLPHQNQFCFSPMWTKWFFNFSTQFCSWSLFLTQQLTSSMTLGKSLKLSMLHFNHLENGYDTTYLPDPGVVRLKFLLSFAKHLELYIKSCCSGGVNQFLYECFLGLSLVQHFCAHSYLLFLSLSNTHQTVLKVNFTGKKGV